MPSEHYNQLIAEQAIADAEREALRRVVHEAVAEAFPRMQALSPEEVTWVKLAIQREAQSVKLRQAIIEKTLAGLVWAGVLGLGAVVLEYLKNHGWRV